MTGQIASRTATEAGGLLGPAIPLLEECRVFARYGLLPVEQPEQLLEHLAVRMRFRPNLDWLSYGDEQGRFTGVWRRRSDGTLIANRSWPEGGRVRLIEYELLPEGGRGALVRSSDDHGYDPRERPWYRLGAQSTVPVWTEPYDWYDEGGVGITLALGLRDEHGAVRGVFTADLLLDSISRFLLARSRQDLGPEGSAYMMTRDGKVVAGPGVVKVEAQHPLLTAALRALGGSLLLLPVGASASTTFTYEERRWIASFAVFPVEGGLQWVSAAVVPFEHFHGEVDRMIRRASWGGAAVLALAILIGGWSLLGARRRMRKRMKRKAAGRPRPPGLRPEPPGGSAGGGRGPADADQLPAGAPGAGTGLEDPGDPVAAVAAAPAGIELPVEQHVPVAHDDRRPAARTIGGTPLGVVHVARVHVVQPVAERDLPRAAERGRRGGRHVHHL
ncbi:MAG: hypothetical protein KatS3mg102_0023 [Planctomycetota bacterium]|nr:MAG: hypothetical protein KatS3mg102_0023 [Planctomycetota bacterium]